MKKAQTSSEKAKALRPCTVVARVDDLDRLIASADESWGPGRGRQFIFDECSRLFMDARHTAEVTHDRVNAADGEVQFIFGSAENGEKFCRCVIDRFEERNVGIANAEFHIRMRLAIGPAPMDGKAANGQGFASHDTAVLLQPSRPGEIWITGEVYEALPDAVRAPYVVPTRVPAKNEKPPPSGARMLRLKTIQSGSSEKCVMVVDMAEFSRIQRYEQELNGTAGVTRLQVQIKSIMASGFKDVASSYEDALREFAGDGGIFTFEQPEEAHHVAVAILQASERESEKGRALKIREALRCFRIGIDYGECGRDRQRQLTSVIISRARRLEAGGPAGEIRISTDAYGRLPEPVQRQYGKEELLRGKKHDEPIPAHRFTVVSQASWPRSGKAATRDAAASDKLTRISAGECFVVSPINERDQRIAAVFKGLISAACERLGFEAKRADHIPGTDRVPLITGRLSTAPLVIAYLGNPSPRWNPDVMLEVGFRFATGLPLVLLSELPHKKGRLAVSFTNILPFHLVNKSVLEVPKTPAAAVERLVDAMRVALSEKSSTEWNTLFPIVECHFADFQGEVTLTYASPEAEALFHLGAARGVRISIADRQRFRDRVEPAQLRAYMMEQFELMRRIQAKAMGLDSIFNGGGGELLANIPPARVPLIFKDDPRGANGKPTAYLPQIVRYQIKSGIIHLRTLYLRVSDSLRQDPSGHWICEL